MIKLDQDQEQSLQARLREFFSKTGIRPYVYFVGPSHEYLPVYTKLIFITLLLWGGSLFLLPLLSEKASILEETFWSLHLLLIFFVFAHLLLLWPKFRKLLGAQSDARKRSYQTHHQIYLQELDPEDKEALHFFISPHESRLLILSNPTMSSKIPSTAIQRASKSFLDSLDLNEKRPYLAAIFSALEALETELQESGPQESTEEISPI